MIFKLNSSFELGGGQQYINTFEILEITKTHKCTNAQNTFYIFLSL